MPYLASEGKPRRLRIDVTMSTAMATVVSVPLAVEIIFLRPEDVTGASVTGMFCLLILLY